MKPNINTYDNIIKKTGNYMGRILVVEDDENVRWSIVELLREEGYTVYESENGLEGINAARKLLPDLIVSDIMMPEVDGLGVLKALQQDTITSLIPFIFLTAKTDPLDIRIGMREGADDYLTKPYKAADLLDSVNARIQKRKNYDEKISELYNNITRSIPHELRTPLISILGYSQIIKEDINTLEKHEIVEMSERIYISGKSLLKIIQKFLIYNEINASLMDKESLVKYKKAITRDADLFIQSVIKQSAEEAKRTNDLLFELDKASINIYEENFEIVIKELIENSFKFSEQGTKVIVTGKICNNKYSLTIADHGVGLNKEQVNSIGIMKQFDKEIQFQPGVGMGLPLSLKILQLYEAIVTVDSSKNEYTRILIQLPLAEL